MRPLNTLTADDFKLYIEYALAKNFTEATIGVLVEYLKTEEDIDITTVLKKVGLKYDLGDAAHMKAMLEAVKVISIEYIKTGGREARAAITSYTKSLGSLYGYSRAELIEAYGEYCNYCDMRIADSALAIEHLVPKSTFPDEMINYTNFYLACPSCNSHKLDEPKTNTIIDMINLDPHIDPKLSTGNMDDNGYELMKNVIRNDYMWPQMSNAGSYSKLYYSPQYNQDGYSNMDNFLKGDYIYMLGRVLGSGGKEVALILQSNDTTAQRTIKDIVKLNNYIPDSLENLKLSDRRLFNRTKTALAISNGIQNFINLMGEVNTQTQGNIIQLFIEQWAEEAQFSGFFSLYVFIITNAVIDEKYKKCLFNALLGKYSNTQIFNPVNA